MTCEPDVRSASPFTLAELLAFAYHRTTIRSCARGAGCRSRLQRGKSGESPALSRNGKALLPSPNALPQANYRDDVLRVKGRVAASGFRSFEPSEASAPPTLSESRVATLEGQWNR